MFLFASLLTVALLVMVFLASTVRKQLHELETATSDNVQWSLSQLEVEHLAFVQELEKASISETAQFDELRRRFDVFYSRVSTLSSGGIYAVLREDPGTDKNVEELRQLVEQSASLIDLPDDELRENLDLLLQTALQIRQTARSFALQGIKHFSDQRDKQRKSVHQTLAAIAVLTVVLLLVLLILVFFLSKLNRQNQARARENELRESRMSAIVTTSLDAIVAINQQGYVVDFNGAAEEIFGYSSAEAIGARMTDLIIPEHYQEAHEAGLKRYQETGEKRVIGKGRIRMDAKRKNGDLFPVEFSIAIAKGEDSEIVISYLRDISKEMDAENELKEARDAAIAGNEAKSRFLAVMSHEMRTPLNGLLGTMELLDDTKLNDQQRRFLHIMESSGKQLLSHVNDVLDLARLEAGKTDFDTSIFDIQPMIEELVEGQIASARSVNDELEFTPSQDQILVATDRVRLRQVLLNLVGNAIKFTRDGSISVEAEVLRDGKTLELRVIDTGIGIAEDRVEQIFEDFTTLDSSFGRKADGTGLGLGIAKRITEALGGTIGVESELGDGSLFWVRLPIVVPEAEMPGMALQKAQAGNSGQEIVTSKMKILLVEDNQINREVARNFLEGDSHSVIEAQDGAEGVRLANCDLFDLILMDISMPEMDGIQAARAIREGEGVSKNAPIIALTAHTQKDDVKKFLDAGMNDVVFKPVTRHALRAILRKISVGEIGSKSTSQNAPINEKDMIDYSILSRFRDDIGEGFPIILDKFIQETDAAIETLCSSDPNHHPKDLAALAHRLSGSAALFGTVAFRRQLNEIEEHAETHDPDELNDLCTHTRTLWLETRANLQQLS